MLPTFYPNKDLNPDLSMIRTSFQGLTHLPSLSSIICSQDIHTMTFPTGAHFLGPPQALPNNPWRCRARFPPPCRQAVLQNVQI